MNLRYSSQARGLAAHALVHRPALFGAACCAALLAACGGAAPAASSTVPAASQAPTSAAVSAKPSAAPSGAASGKPAASAAVKVKLGYNPILAGAAMYFAQDRGYFAAQNLDVEFIPFDSGALMNAPLSAGQLDAIPATPSPGLFNAMARDVTLKAVAANNLTNATLVVRKDLADSGQVKQVADLKGKKVSLNVEGSPVDYGVRNILYKSGLTLKDVDVQRVVNTDTAVALSNKAIDAGSASEPLSTQIIQKSIAVKLANSSEFIGNQTASFVAFGPSFLNRTDDVPVRFLRAYLKGFADYGSAAKGGTITNPADLAVISKWTKVPQETIAISPIVPPPSDSRVDIEDLKKQQDFWKTEGTVTNPVDLTKFVEYKYVDAAKAA